MRGLLRGAWRTVVPAPDDPHGPLPPLLLGLTVTSGLVDAVSYLLLGQVFVANMTGNVAFLAFGLAGVPQFSRSATLTALAGFALGALLGGRLISRVPHRGRAMLHGVFLETVLVAAAAALAAAGPDPVAGPARYLATAVLAVAMGFQNAMVHLLGVPDLTTTVLTRTMAGALADTGAGRSRAEQTGRRLLSVLVLLLGAAAGALVVRHLNRQLALAAPAVMLFAVTLAAATGAARSREDWTRVC
ncbi:YoaK family protein [Kitasatospora sp. NPDC052896]|uniref:YoaK family protein n=1 Tax=Kitasatospora sp. NPDC052896 TaxID=3364061 RepID=UPI0037CA019F